MRGVYLVAAELARLGFIASPTSRSAIGADLLATDQACQRAYSVQVKTNAVSFGWFLVGKHAADLKSETLIYVLVNLTKSGPDFFIGPSMEIAPLVQETTRPNSTWYGIRCNDVEKYQGKWTEAFGKPTVDPVAADENTNAE
jgi:hypothetical protein